MLRANDSIRFQTFDIESRPMNYSVVVLAKINSYYGPPSQPAVIPLPELSKFEIFKILIFSNSFFG